MIFGERASSSIRLSTVLECQMGSWKNARDTAVVQSKTIVLVLVPMALVRYQPTPNHHIETRLLCEHHHFLASHPAI
jgi:hypothetical protein